MSTRLNLSSYATSSPGAIAQDSSWELVAAWIASRATSPKLASPTPGSSVTPTKSSAANPCDMLLGQHTTAPLDGAQTIAGTLTVCIRTLESVATADAFLQLVVRVVNERGNVVRGTLFSGQTQTTVSATPADANGESPTGTAAVRHVTVSLSSVAAQDRDRVVIETGQRSVTASTGFTLHNRYGDDAAGDLPLTAGDTSSANAWVEFSQTLALVPLAAPDRRKIISLGDSLLAGFSANMATDMAALGFDTPQVDALAGRFITTPGATAFRSISLIHYFRAFAPTPYEPHTWVIQLGTNDVLSASAANHQGSIDTLLRLIDEQTQPKRVYWVNGIGDTAVGTGNPGGSGGDFATFNGKLVSTAAARRDMEVIDWAAYALANGNPASWWDAGDAQNVHMTAEGYERKRQFLTAWLAARTFEGWGGRL